MNRIPGKLSVNRTKQTTAAPRPFFKNVIPEPSTKSYSPNDHAVHRADEMLCAYHPIVSAAAVRGEAPPATLLDKPDALRETLEDALCDLHHLADAAGISWESVQAGADKSYEQEVEDNRVANQRG